MASMWPPKKNTAFTLYFTLYKNDGTVIANPGTITKKYSIDGAAVGDCSNSVTEEDTTYGQLSLVIAQAEMNGDAIWIYIKDDTSGCVPFTCTLYTVANTQDEIVAGTVHAKVDVDTIKTQAVTCGAGVTIGAYVGNATAALAVDAQGKVAVPDTQKVDVNTIKTQAITCAAGVTVLASVGTAATSTAQTGDSYAIVNGDHGLVSIQDDMDAVYAAVITNAAGADIGADTTEILTRLPDASPGANGGLPTTNGTKLNQTVDLTAGQSITASSITGVTFPTNFSALSISATTGLVDITQTAADKVWGTATRVLTAGTNLSFSTHSAADVAALILVTPAQKIVTDANGYVTYSNAAPLNAAGVAGAVWNAATASYGTADTYGALIETNLDAAVSTRSSHSAADVKTAIEAAGSSIASILADTGELQANQGNWLTATGFSTHNAGDVKTAIEADGSMLYELMQWLGGKVVIDRDNNTAKVYKANGTDLIATITRTTVGNVDTLARS